MIPIDILTFLWKIILSVLLGAIIGLERDREHKPAGFRDTILVILGATLLTIFTLELQKLNVNFDFSRIMGYTVAGVGFLGSGLIMRNENKLEGITTASLLFSLLAIGFFIGIESYVYSILATISVYIILILKRVKITLEKEVRKCRKKQKSLKKK